MPDSGDGHSSGSRTARLGGRLNIGTSQSMIMSVLLARVEACRRPGAQRVTPRRNPDTCACRGGVDRSTPSDSLSTFTSVDLSTMTRRSARPSRRARRRGRRPA
jgi:hypothetical protein